MIPEDVALLRDILMTFATNSESQATKWAIKIVEGLERHGYMVLETDREDEEIPF